jgi:hypothetical protein
MLLSALRVSATPCGSVQYCPRHAHIDVSQIMGTEFRVYIQSLRFGAWGLGFEVRGLGFGVWGLGFGVWGLGLGVLGLGLEVRG